MFTGLQSDNWVPIQNEPPAPSTFDIIQPVLQYGGASENGGGNYWGVASWYVTLNDGALWSTELKVNPGAVILGSMIMTGPTTWFISGAVNGQNTSITVNKPRLAEQPWAYNTLEVYNIGSCSYFPPSGSASSFTNLQLSDAKGTVTPTWISNANKGHCTAHLTVTNPSTVSIGF